jgi:transcriptional regulator with XRE-family HTH domain
MPKACSAEPTSPSVLVGRNIRAELFRHGLRQADLAAPLRVVPSAVSHRLTGRTPLDINELVSIAQLLGIPLGRLLDGIDEPIGAAS